MHPFPTNLQSKRREMSKKSIFSDPLVSVIRSLCIKPTLHASIDTTRKKKNNECPRSQDTYNTMVVLSNIDLHFNLERIDAFAMSFSLTFPPRSPPMIGKFVKTTIVQGTNCISSTNAPLIRTQRAPTQKLM